MRLRNKPWADDFLNNSENVINNPNKKIIKKTFGKSKELHLEIGCGKGSFIYSHSLNNPEINYIGMEKFSSVLVIPVKKYHLSNLKFIWEDAENLENIFKRKSINKIYINFPDPWPKKRHSKRRLVFNKFFKKYYKILSNNGVIEFKTDQKDLYEFAKEQLSIFKKFKIIEESKNLHKDKSNIITTEYERRFTSMGHPIYYIKLVK